METDPASERRPPATTLGPDIPFGAPEYDLTDVTATDVGEAAAPWTREVPISVNDTYGDPFITEQITNTVDKLSTLRTHRAPIAIFTKAGYSAEVLDLLQEVADINRIVVFYSLTGLNEGGIGFAERVHMIEELTSLFAHTFIFTRPIIRNRNDNPTMLQTLAQVAADTTGQLVLGGLHDAKKRKQRDRPVEHALIEYCERRNVAAFFKTPCAAAWRQDTTCWVHNLGKPKNMEVVRSLGYNVTADDETVFLDEGSTGDINFIRAVTRANVHVGKIISNYNMLTMPTGEHKLENTSSWFAWSDNIDTCLDCDYCIIKQIEYLRKYRVRIGVHPTRLPEVATGVKSDRLMTMTRTKLPVDDQERHQYGDVRVETPCRIPLYGVPK